MATREEMRRPGSCRERWIKYQKDNPEKARQVRANQAKRRRKLNREMLDQLKNVPCCDCGEAFLPCVMVFDHVRGEKIANVSAMTSWPIGRIKEELEKCDVVCSNCHAIRTWIRAQQSEKE